MELHTAGGWSEHDVYAHIEAPAGSTSLVSRVVSDESEVQMVRVYGDFKLITAEGTVPLEQKSNRGLQIHLQDQKLDPGAVNHVRVSLADALVKDGKHGWKLRPTVSATVSPQDSDLVAAAVTPEAGGVLALDNGFEVVIPREPPRTASSRSSSA
ncbi:hypothetical protein [Nannocystis pusilla]|uniref:hypothetical protein n=1 Tax=Nannocystis pusilla TaxID=889268 RepID=UPI003B7D4F8F